jgi:hypothetical protein
MARIQVLPLTTRTLGPASETPFVLVIDQADDVHSSTGLPVWSEEQCQAVASATGAVLVLVIPSELTVANVDEELHRAAQAAVERALNPPVGIVA